MPSKLINQLLNEAFKKKAEAGERELSYWSGVVDGLSSAYDAASLAEIVMTRVTTDV